MVSLRVILMSYLCSYPEFPLNGGDENYKDNTIWQRAWSSTYTISTYLSLGRDLMRERTRSRIQYGGR